MVAVESYITGKLGRASKKVNGGSEKNAKRPSICLGGKGRGWGGGEIFYFYFILSNIFRYFSGCSRPVFILFLSLD